MRGTCTDYDVVLTSEFKLKGQWRLRGLLDPGPKSYVGACLKFFANEEYSQALLR